MTEPGAGDSVGLRTGVRISGAGVASHWSPLQGISLGPSGGNAVTRVWAHAYHPFCGNHKPRSGT